MSHVRIGTSPTSRGIGAAGMFGLPVSTTHVLSSGVAGAMRKWLGRALRRVRAPVLFGFEFGGPLFAAIEQATEDYVAALDAAIRIFSRPMTS